MPVNWQNIPISFTQGLDTKSDPKQLPSGKLLDLQNGVFQHPGQISKRWGYQKLGSNILGTNNALDDVVALNPFQSELLAYDSQSAFSYSSADQGWLNRGEVVSIIQSETQILRNNVQQLSPDCATLNRVSVYAWEDARGGIRYSVWDATTNTALVSDQPIYTTAPSASDIRPKVLAFPSANVIVILFANGTHIRGVAINPGYPFPVNSTFFSLASGVHNPAYYDATVVGNQVYVAYFTNTQVQLANFTTSFSNPTTLAVASISSIPTGCINVSSDTNQNIWVVYGDPNAGTPSFSTVAYTYGLGSVYKARTVVITGTPSASLTTLQSCTAIESSPLTLTVYGEFQGAQPYFNFISQNTVNLDGYGSQSVFKRTVGLASKPFIWQGDVYVNVAHQSALQPMYFTLDAQGREVAKSNPNIGGGLISSSDYLLPECSQVSPGVFQYANLVKGDPITQAGQLFQLLGVNATTLDFEDTNRFLSTELNQNLYTVGAIVQSYDGASYYEHGTHLYPENITASIHTSGGTILPGNYQYAVTYEWTDNNGNVQYSSPSVAFAVVIPSDGYSTHSVSLTCPTLALTKKPGIRVVFYRTTDTGSLLFRVSSATAPVYNDPTVDTVSFLDTQGDGYIQANGLMYTQPFTQGVNPILPNVAPPSCTLIANYANRVWLGGLEDRNTLWFSKQRIAGIPVEFSDVLTLQVDGHGGPITALGVLNNALIIFKQSSIFSLTGVGPDNTGSLPNDFNYPGPVNIISDVGCSEPNSIVYTPGGLMFKSAKGIYLLDQNQNVTYIGAPVEAYNDLEIVSATLVPSQWVIFTTSSDTALVFDYLQGQWGTFTNHASVDSCLWLGGGNTFAFANASGQVYQQTLSTFVDDTVAIRLSATTGWLDLAGLQGYQRIRRFLILGNFYGPHTLQVNIAYDYVDNFVQFATIDVPAIGTFGSTGPYGLNSNGGVYGGLPFVYQFRINVSKQKCQAIKIQIQDAQSANFNQGYAISAITLEAGMKQGTFKLPAGKQAPSV
jgi:hypothetical protein